MAIFLIKGSSSVSTNFLIATTFPVSLCRHLNTIPYRTFKSWDSNFKTPKGSFYGTLQKNRFLTEKSHSKITKSLFKRAVAAFPDFTDPFVTVES